jgi:hypothetical protein
VTRPGKPAVVRFYFDADVLGLAKVLVQVRADVTYPGDPGGTLHRRIRPACPITSTAVKDDVWISQVASLGWLIITRDSRIASKRAELAAVRETGARMVALPDPKPLAHGRNWKCFAVSGAQSNADAKSWARSFAALHEQPCVPSRSTDDHSSLIVFVGTGS